MEAAFFDLDKTVIAKASIMAFAADFRREGLLTRRSLASGAWQQLLYTHAGANAEKLAEIRQSVLAMTRGWEQSQVREIVTRRLQEVIDPITYSDACSLMAEHREAGRRIYVISAAPAEIVEPVSERLGADVALASVARLDEDGRYSGELELYAYGPVKADLMRQIAERDDIDLAESYAYSDSETDIPMLEMVGHPVAVNPDRALRKVAMERGWEVRRFKDTVAETHHASWVWAGSAVAAAAAGGAGAIAWRIRVQPGRRVA